MTSIIGDRITAKDLSQVVIVSNNVKKKTDESTFSASDIAWQEQRLSLIHISEPTRPY